MFYAHIHVTLISLHPPSGNTAKICLPPGSAVLSNDLGSTLFIIITFCHQSIIMIIHQAFLVLSDMVLVTVSQVSVCLLCVCPVLLSLCCIELLPFFHLLVNVSAVTYWWWFLLPCHLNLFQLLWIAHAFMALQSGLPVHWIFLLSVVSWNLTSHFYGSPLLCWCDLYMSIGSCNCKSYLGHYLSCSICHCGHQIHVPLLFCVSRVPHLLTALL